VHTVQGCVKADWVVPAIEGYASSVPPLGNRQLPTQGLIVVPEDEPNLRRYLMGELFPRLRYAPSTALNDSNPVGVPLHLHI
jgi:glycine/D-amino acid oxidase-like deaminating enzyme